MIVTKGMINGFSGNRKEAFEALTEIERILYPEPISPWYYASIYLSIKDKDKFFEFTNKAFEQRDPLMVYFQNVAVYDSNFKKDPRFHEMLKKMKIED